MLVATSNRMTNDQHNHYFIVNAFLRHTRISLLATTEVPLGQALHPEYQKFSGCTRSSQVCLKLSE